MKVQSESRQEALWEVTGKRSVDRGRVGHPWNPSTWEDQTSRSSLATQLKASFSCLILSFLFFLGGGGGGSGGYKTLRDLNQLPKITEYKNYNTSLPGIFPKRTAFWAGWNGYSEEHLKIFGNRNNLSQYISFLGNFFISGKIGYHGRNGSWFASLLQTAPFPPF